MKATHRSIRWLLSAAGLGMCSVLGQPQSGFYEITAQTVMPHLEENLRYAVVREQRCLQLDEPDSFFPILRHPSLEGCHLNNRYRLVCANPEVATGTARLDAAGGRIAGILEVKMGGKNMTFSQRIEAVLLSDCVGVVAPQGVP